MKLMKLKKNATHVRKIEIMTHLENLMNERQQVQEALYSQMMKSLKEGTCKVVFTKQSTGETREMICTLQESIVPPATKSDPLSQTKVRTLNKEVIAAWDIENQGWRSFRIDSVVSFLPRT